MCAPGAVSNGVYQVDTGAYLGNEWPTTATVAIATPDRTLTLTRVFNGPDPNLTQRVATVSFPGGMITEVTGNRTVAFPDPPTGRDPSEPPRKAPRRRLQPLGLGGVFTRVDLGLCLRATRLRLESIEQGCPRAVVQL